MREEKTPQTLNPQPSTPRFVKELRRLCRAPFPTSAGSACAGSAGVGLGVLGQVWNARALCHGKGFAEVRMFTAQVCRRTGATVLSGGDVYGTGASPPLWELVVVQAWGLT